MGRVFRPSVLCALCALCGFRSCVSELGCPMMRALAECLGGSMRRLLHRVALVAVGGAVAACAHGEVAASREPAYETAAVTGEPQPRSEVLIGYATWYGAALAGHTTASGERFDPSKMTAA